MKILDWIRIAKISDLFNTGVHWTLARSGTTGAKGTAATPQMTLCASALILYQCFTFDSQH